MLFKMFIVFKIIILLNSINLSFSALSYLPRSFDRNVDIYFEAHRHTGRTRFPLKGHDFFYEEEIKYTLYCQKSSSMSSWTLRWQVDMYGIKSEEMQSNISIDIIPNRYDDKLKISCIASYFEMDHVIETVTLRLSEGQDKKNINIEIRKVYEGNTRVADKGYHCVLEYRNSTKTKYTGWSNDKIIENIHMDEDGSLLLCANLNKTNYYNYYLRYHIVNFYLDLMKKRISVIPLNSPAQTTPHNSSKMPTTLDSGCKKTSTEAERDPSFPIIEVVSGVIALVIVFIICILAYRYLTRKKNSILMDQIYSEPHVVYTELEEEGLYTVPQMDKTPSVKIIGIVKPISRTNIPVLPTNKEDAPIYQEIIEYTVIDHNGSASNYVPKNNIVADASEYGYTEIMNYTETNDNNYDLITNDMYITHDEAENTVTQNMVTNESHRDDNGDMEVINDLYITDNSCKNIFSKRN